MQIKAGHVFHEFVGQRGFLELGEYLVDLRVHRRLSIC